MGFLLFLKTPLAKYLGIFIAVSIAMWGLYSAIGNRFTTICERNHQAAIAESVQRAAEEARSIALQDAEVIAWADKARTTTVFKTLWREHETTNYADCALTPAGRVLQNYATRHATDISDSSIESESGSASTDTGKRDASGDGSDTLTPHGSDAPVSNRPGSSTEDAGSAWSIGG